MNYTSLKLNSLKSISVKEQKERDEKILKGYDYTKDNTYNLDMSNQEIDAILRG